MEYITFIEHNHKENESFIMFLQWTGNEEMLTKLRDFIVSADPSNLCGDYSEFEMDINNKVSESTANEMIKLDYGSYSNMYQKVNGTFLYSALDEMDAEKKASQLDEDFFHCKIRYCFS